MPIVKYSNVILLWIHKLKFFFSNVVEIIQYDVTESVWFLVSDGGLQIHSFIHLFCKKQLTERNCTIKLENWLKYY